LQKNRVQVCCEYADPSLEVAADYGMSGALFFESLQ